MSAECESEPGDRVRRDEKLESPYMVEKCYGVNAEPYEFMDDTKIIKSIIELYVFGRAGLGAQRVRRGTARCKKISTETIVKDRNKWDLWLRLWDNMTSHRQCFILQCYIIENDWANGSLERRSSPRLINQSGACGKNKINQYLANLKSDWRMLMTWQKRIAPLTLLPIPVEFHDEFVKRIQFYFSWITRSGKLKVIEVFSSHNLAAMECRQSAPFHRVWSFLGSRWSGSPFNHFFAFFHCSSNLVILKIRHEIIPAYLTLLAWVSTDKRSESCAGNPSWTYTLTYHNP